MWVSHTPSIFYEAVSSEGSALEQRGITLDYYVDSALVLSKCQEKYAGVCPPSKVAFHKEVVLWMVQHKARLIYWSFTEKDMFNYGIKGLVLFFSSFDFKLLFFSLILIFFGKITEHETTGPANEPLPASSHPTSMRFAVCEDLIIWGV